MNHHKLFYCIAWSLGLFVATFYGLISQELDGKKVFDFTDVSLLDAAKSHLMPMLMAMTLYLWDVLYNIYTKGIESSHDTFWILLTIIVFMLAFIFSILVNSNPLGWGLFVLSWLALTVLKYKTTQDTVESLYRITED